MINGLSAKRHLVLVDERVEDFNLLAERFDVEVNAQVDVFHVTDFDPAAPWLASVLQAASACDVISIFAHGEDDGFRLGHDLVDATWLAQQTLPKSNASLHIYACYAGSKPALMAELQTIGLAVAASRGPLGGVCQDPIVFDVWGSTARVVAPPTSQLLSAGGLAAYPHNLSGLVITGDTNVVGPGADSVFGTADDEIDPNDILYGGAGNDTINGLTGEDQLYGLAGDDNLNGGDGADFMDGGEGNDSFTVDNTGDIVVGGTGSDTIGTFVTLSNLPDDVENLILINSLLV
ncbi:MAG: DUF4347 domain-containing protein, partial [Pseudomonadota bacterium]